MKQILLMIVYSGLIQIGLSQSKPALSKSQLVFIKTVEPFCAAYVAAPNELKKSALRAQRKIAISKMVGNGKVAGWIGTLEGMGTNSEGKAYVAVKLEGSRSISVKTWNNALSDIGSNTLIENGSNLFNSISNCSKGDKVVFSGHFFAGKLSKLDFIEEASLTEMGSMTSPEFIFKFSAISKKLSNKK